MQVGRERITESLDDMSTEEKTGIGDILDQIADNQENGGYLISGRIYRFLYPDDPQGRQTTELVGKVDNFVDEDYVGRLYGSGKYKIRYNIKNGDRPDDPTVKKVLIYQVGKEYDKFVTRAEVEDREATARENYAVRQKTAGPLDSIFGTLTPEKITAWALAIKTVKEVFAPPPPPDFSGLLQAVLSAQKQPAPALSDSIVLSAMDALRAKNEPPDVLEQIVKLKRVKDALKDEAADEDEGGKPGKIDGESMNLLIKTGLQLLGGMLEKNHQNYEAVGRAAAQMPYIKNLVADDPDLAQDFFEAARDKYGLDGARKLAAGFGIKIDEAPGQIEDAANQNEILNQGATA